ncbi:ABC transporter ATP-binding protein [Halogeometricum borinquense]|uniref:ABC transporter ATP-binding protein n=1 Tax=Halogeometricum borinquense TaxID=60847 RepID=A0A482T801_9EURY|nr:ABC transporter ATP-binding protein [Halogeometricum borinquense]RYJ08029.1 ABC transporter ATP-binding protein [Halogeometricum borinquense]
MAAIETIDLTKSYGNHTAIDDINLTVRNGEVFGFLGPNGAGKSTTLNILLGYTRRYEGTVTVLGHDVQTGSRAARERIGVLSENYALYDRLTGVEHLRLAQRLKRTEADIDGILERVGLSRDAAERRTAGYSTGMRQRLALATAIVGDPDLLILDEPSSGLDPNGVALLRQLIQTEAESGTAVFFSSHILEHVESVCDRVGILNNGQLAAIGSMNELRDELDPGSSNENALEAIFEAHTAETEPVEPHRTISDEDTVV